MNLTPKQFKEVFGSKSIRCGRALRNPLVLFLVCSTLSGCEYRTLYGVELTDFDDAEEWKLVEGGNSRLYLLAANSTEAPGITLIAVSNDSPAEPTWDWEDFQSMPLDKRASEFGAFYDRKYRDLSISHSAVCPLLVENFDHRESAQEVAYGKWLHDLSSGQIGKHPKGVSVTVPLSNCDQRKTEPAGAIEILTVTIDGGRDQEAQAVEIRFRVYPIDQQVHWLF